MSVIAIRYASHTSKALCKRTQHCWPATPNMVGCYMLCPFTHPVACCCVLLHPFARGLRCFKSKSLLSIINIFTLYNDPYIFLICYYTFYTVLYIALYSITSWRYLKFNNLTISPLKLPDLQRFLLIIYFLNPFTPRKMQLFICLNQGPRVKKGFILISAATKRVFG